MGVSILSGVPASTGKRSSFSPTTSIMTDKPLSTSAKKGVACMQCHGHKVKCDGAKPVCSRCQRLHKDCAYPTGVIKRRPKTDILQARILELQLEVHRMTVISKHDLYMATARLQERLKFLGAHRLDRLESTSSGLSWLAVFPLSGQDGRIGGYSLRQERSRQLIQRAAVEHYVDSFQWSPGEEVPLQMSQFLISIFLPYRLQHHFYMDATYFLQCFSLPPSHPESIHPCLLHACYLAACNIVGGRLSAFEPYFLERCRFYLNQALMLADRLPHFLWTSTLLGYYFARNRRLEESFAMVSAACRLATACGFSTTMENSSGLLAPPASKAEAIDRIWLFHSIYMADQSLTALFPFPPTLVCDEEWGPASEDDSKKYSWFKVHSFIAFQWIRLLKKCYPSRCL
ncbi:hypothetical protein DL93DRAFT_1690911 [Clavulina sp. PMI_390]|nr:hypothetical protein DL93DRAFT_1690911 [Clavulina sp. PMI_390]